MKRDGKWGYIDKEGKEVVECKYSIKQIREKLNAYRQEGLNNLPTMEDSKSEHTQKINETCDRGRGEEEIERLLAEFKIY